MKTLTRRTVAAVSVFALLTASAQGAVPKRGISCPVPDIHVPDIHIPDIEVPKLKVPEGDYVKLPPPEPPKNYVKLPPEPPKNYVKLPPDPSNPMGKIPDAPTRPNLPPPPPAADAKLPPARALPPPPPPIAVDLPEVKAPPTKAAPIYDRVDDGLFKDPPVNYSKLGPDAAAPKGPKLSPAEDLAKKVGAEPPSETTLTNKVSKNVGAPGEPPPKPPMKKLAGPRPGAPRETPLRMEAPPKDAPSVQAAKAPMKLKTKLLIGGIVTTVVLGGIGIGAPYAIHAILPDDTGNGSTDDGSTADATPPAMTDANGNPVPPQQ